MSRRRSGMRTKGKDYAERITAMEGEEAAAGKTAGKPEKEDNDEEEEE